MNVLYALTCQTCGLNYIGQTERTVRERNGDYRRAISDKKYHTQGVHEHLATCGKGHYSMTPFFKVHSTNRDYQTILQYESYFIHKFKPALNQSKLGWWASDALLMTFHLVTTISCQSVDFMRSLSLSHFRIILNFMNISDSNVTLVWLKCDSNATRIRLKCDSNVILFSICIFGCTKLFLFLLFVASDHLLMSFMWNMSDDDVFL